MKIKPLADRVVVKMVEAEETTEESTDETTETTTEEGDTAE